MKQSEVGIIRWVHVFLLFLVAAVSFLDRSNVSIAVSAIQSQFQLSNTQMGWVFSAFVVGYAFSQPFAGFIADRFGGRRVIAVGIVWWSLFTALTASVPASVLWSLALLILVRFALGIGESVIFPAANQLVSRWIHTSERGLATGVIFAGVGVGAAIAPPLITFLSLQHNWQWSFYVTAVIGCAVAILWVIVVPDTPEQHPWIRGAERRYILGRVMKAPEPRRESPFSWIIRHRQVQLLAASYFTYGYVAYIFFTWFFKYLSVVRALDLKSSAVYAASPFLAMSVAAPLGGWIADQAARRWGDHRGRCWTASLAMATAAIFVGLSTRVEDPRLACFVLAGGAGALYLSQSAYWTLAADIGGSSAGSVSGVVNMLNQVGGIMTASVTPYIADRYGWSASFELAAGLCAAGAVIWLFIRPVQLVAADIESGAAL